MQWQLCISSVTNGSTEDEHLFAVKATLQQLEEPPPSGRNEWWGEQSYSPWGSQWGPQWGPQCLEV